MTSIEDPDLIAYINQGDKWLSDFLLNGDDIAALLDALEGND